MVRMDPTADASLAAIFARNRFGMAMAAIIRMIATTIKSSMSEKPFCLFRIIRSFSMWLEDAALIGASPAPHRRALGTSNDTTRYFALGQELRRAAGDFVGSPERPNEDRVLADGHELSRIDCPRMPQIVSIPFSLLPPSPEKRGGLNGSTQHLGQSPCAGVYEAKFVLWR